MSLHCEYHKLVPAIDRSSPNVTIGQDRPSWEEKTAVNLIQ